MSTGQKLSCLQNLVGMGRRFRYTSIIFFRTPISKRKILCSLIFLCFQNEVKLKCFNAFSLMEEYVMASKNPQMC